MEQQEITVCAAIIISGLLVYHLIRWNVKFYGVYRGVSAGRLLPHDRGRLRTRRLRVYRDRAPRRQLALCRVLLQPELPLSVWRGISDLTRRSRGGPHGGVPGLWGAGAAHSGDRSRV